MKASEDFLFVNNSESDLLQAMESIIEIVEIKKEVEDFLPENERETSSYTVKQENGNTSESFQIQVINSPLLNDEYENSRNIFLSGSEELVLNQCNEVQEQPSKVIMKILLLGRTQNKFLTTGLQP